MFLKIINFIAKAILVVHSEKLYRLFKKISPTAASKYF